MSSELNGNTLLSSDIHLLEGQLNIKSMITDNSVGGIEEATLNYINENNIDVLAYLISDNQASGQEINAVATSEFKSPYENCDEDYLITKLENYGYEFTFDRYGERHFALIGAPIKSKGFSTKKNNYKGDLNIPDWFLNPPGDKNRIYGVGVSKTKTEAMLFALDELESNYYAEVEYSKDDMSDHQNNERKIISSGGLISQISDDEYNLEFFTKSISTDENFHFSKSLKLSYQDSKPILSNIYGDSEANITSVMKDDGEILYRFEATYKNSGLYHLIDQLKKYGLDIQFGEDSDENHYVLTSINKNYYPDKQGQMKKRLFELWEFGGRSGLLSAAGARRILRPG